MRTRVRYALSTAMSLYALNLFDLADNDDYRAYSRIVALGMHTHPGLARRYRTVSGARSSRVARP